MSGSRRLVLLLVLAAVIGAGGYYAFTNREGLRAWFAQLTSRETARPAAPPQAAPPEVGVLTVQPAEVPLPFEYAGRVAALRDVEVRARVGGLLLRREFDEGARVKEGQVLFRIDPAPYQVALSRAEAQVQQAQATLRQAEENFRRADELFRRGVGTDKQRDDALAARDQAQASLHLAQAEIENAQLNLGYTTIAAPVSGVTALQSPQVGTLILAQQTLLTTITPLDPAYVNFSFTDEEAQEFRELNQKRAKPISEKDLTVELHYGNETVYPQTGRIDTAAQRVDPQTGTIQARAIFPNPDGVLLPGQFVRVIVRGVTLPEALVIPTQAIVQGPQGPSVYVIGENGTVQNRPVRISHQIPAGSVAGDGLRPGDRVVVDGVIRVRPGAPVRPVPAAAPQVAETSPTPPTRDADEARRTGAGGPDASGAARQTGSTAPTASEDAPPRPPARTNPDGARPRAAQPTARQGSGHADGQAGARP